MTKLEIESRIIELKKEIAAIYIKRVAINLAGGVGGVVYASGKSFWAKVGYFFLGNIISEVPSQILFRKVLKIKNAELKDLQNQLLIN